MKIGLFDSGFGGLSILEPIQKQFPGGSYIYIADLNNAPYHDKSENFIKNRAKILAGWLVAKNIDILIIACNTATTIAIKTLRDNFSIPIIGVEPALGLAKDEKSATLLATLPTLKSNRTNNLISLYNLESKITKKSFPHWTQIVDQGKLNNTKTKEILEKDLESISSNETLIIGCTHYIFFINKIKTLRPDLKIFDPRIGILKQTKKYSEVLPKDLNSNKTIEIYTTRKLTDTKALESLLNTQTSVKSISL